MAILGKRKAPEPAVSPEEAQEIFRRHFEAQFQPIRDRRTVAASDDETDGDSDEDDATEGSTDGDESEWGGLSNDEISDDGGGGASSTVEVIDHSVSQPSKPVAMSKRELKAFMSSRPPDQNARSTSSSTTTSQPQTASASSLPEDAPSLLAQDLELRRLISESHLLASPSLTSSSAADGQPKTFAAGRVRHKATDLRVQALGSRESIHTQKSMPMNMRKGIVAAATARETKRRREARENNVVLEKETGKKKRRDRVKGMGVDRPGVGRLKGAELRINEHDVKRIEGTRDVFGRKASRGR